ncbi:MAG: T9SS type A sorting domain-containing protein [Candidatus Marinimicrobia bacterium]|nr:T9SS type A sorting domain-containing protein [Candidatus Neomarinimicrobiota bacterium]
MKRLAVMILMVVAGLSAGTYSGEGDGSSGNPYQIASLNDLLELSTTSGDWAAGKYFIQTADFDASATSTWNSGAGFSPIGNASVPFTGSYDGQGYTISNLFINRPGTDYIGLFGYGTGTLKNITLTDVNFTGNRTVGGLAGFFGYYNWVTGSITNCSVSGSVTSGSSDSGLLVGWWSTGTITNCHSSGSVSNGNTSAGGLVGDFSGGTLTGCYSTATVSGSVSQAVGGLVGYCGDGGDVINSYATGNVTGSDYIGGLVGGTSGDGSSISSCYALGDVTGDDYIGGLIGQLFDPIENCYAMGAVTTTAWPWGYNGGCGGLVGHLKYDGSVSTSYSTGLVTSTYNQGGLLGYQEAGTLSGNMYDTESSQCSDGVGSNASATGVTGKTTTQMKDYTTYTAAGWDFVTETANGTNDYWDADQTTLVNSGYPILSWQTDADQSLPVELSSWQVESKNGQVTLSWLTDSESENLGFIIERSNAQTGPFKELASFVTDKTLNGAGSSSHAHEYKWIDTDVKAGESWYYRLSDMAYNGEITRHAVLHTVVKSAIMDLKPHDFTLQPAYPNPFNPSTSIRYGLAEETNVRVMVYDMRGIEIQVLEQGPKSAGWYELQWQGTDAQGRQLASGVYMVVFRAGSQQIVQKLMFLK